MNPTTKHEAKARPVFDLDTIPVANELNRTHTANHIAWMKTQADYKPVDCFDGMRQIHVTHHREPEITGCAAWPYDPDWIVFACVYYPRRKSYWVVGINTNSGGEDFRWQCQPVDPDGWYWRYDFRACEYFVNESR